MVLNLEFIGQLTCETRGGSENQGSQNSNGRFSKSIWSYTTRLVPLESCVPLLSRSANCLQFINNLRTVFLANVLESSSKSDPRISYFGVGALSGT